MDKARVVALLWGVALLGLFVLAFALKLPFLQSLPYGDENLHFTVARDHDEPTPGYQDVFGGKHGAPPQLFWQRPAFYVAFHLPAQAGFEAFRVSQALVASTLAPLGAMLLRAHGSARITACSAGVALAVAPPLALYGSFAFMDVLMMVAVLAFLLARHRRRWALSGALAVLAVWTKESAYAVVVALFAIDVVRGLRRGTTSLFPLRMAPREAGLAYAVVLAPLPLAWSIATGLLPPGGPAYGRLGPIVDLLLPTVWLAPLLIAGLMPRRSRFLCAAGLAACITCGLLFLAGRAVEAWYAVPSLVLGILGCASAADAFVRLVAARTRALAGSRRANLRLRAWTARAGATVPGLLALALCLAFAFLPAGAARSALDPLGPPRASLAASWRFEAEVRGQDLAAALAEIPLRDRVDVLLEQNDWPLPFVQLQGAGTVYVDFPGVRTYVGFSQDALAARIENATTWTLLGRGTDPMQLAIPEVYADCLVATHGGWQVYYGAPCAGRAEALRAADRAHGGL